MTDWPWKIAGLVLIGVMLLLIGNGALDQEGGWYLGAGLVVMLFAVIGREGGLAAARYRADRRAGTAPGAALENSLSLLAPRPFVRLLLAEPRIWSALLRWALRRPPAAGEFGYARRSILGLLLGVALLSAPVEILVIELLIPWDLVRIILLLAAIDATLWAIGLYASLRVDRHRLDPQGVHVYYGVLAHAYVPYADLAAVDAAPRKAPQGREGLRLAPGERAAYLAVGGRTDCTLRLRAPLAVEGLLRVTPPVMTIHVAADDPAGLVAALDARLAADAEPVLPPAAARDTQTIAAR